MPGHAWPPTPPPSRPLAAAPRCPVPCLWSAGRPEPLRSLAQSFCGAFAAPGRAAPPPRSGRGPPSAALSALRLHRKFAPMGNQAPVGAAQRRTRRCARRPVRRRRRPTRRPSLLKPCSRRGGPRPLSAGRPLRPRSASRQLSTRRLRFSAAPLRPSSSAPGTTRAQPGSTETRTMTASR